MISRNCKSENKKSFKYLVASFRELNVENGENGERAIHAMTRDHRVCGSEISCHELGSRDTVVFLEILVFLVSSRNRPRRSRKTTDRARAWCVANCREDCEERALHIMG